MSTSLIKATRDALEILEEQDPEDRAPAYLRRAVKEERMTSNAPDQNNMPTKAKGIVGWGGIAEAILSLANDHKGVQVGDTFTPKFGGPDIVLEAWDPLLGEDGAYRVGPEDWQTITEASVLDLYRLKHRPPVFEPWVAPFARWHARHLKALDHARVVRAVLVAFDDGGDILRDTGPFAHLTQRLQAKVILCALDAALGLERNHGRD